VSELLKAWKQGLGLPDALVIDGHVHVGEWPQACTFASVDEAVAESEAYLDANGVDAFCGFGGGMFRGSDYQQGNDFLLAVWRRLPERCIPFMALNPNDSADALKQELDRMFSAGVRCIKLINDYQEQYPGDGPNMTVAYEYAARQGMLVFNHGWAREVILKVSKQFPATGFVFGHYSNGLDDILVERGNVYANIWNLGTTGWLERGVRKVGAHKFMLGSDGFLNPLSVGIGPVVFAGVTDDEKRMVLGTNLARLLDKVGALPQAIRTKWGHLV
jgi:uncharacterized protein